MARKHPWNSSISRRLHAPIHLYGEADGSKLSSWPRHWSPGRITWNDTEIFYAFEPEVFRSPGKTTADSTVYQSLIFTDSKSRGQQLNLVAVPTKKEGFPSFHRFYNGFIRWNWRLVSNNNRLVTMGVFRNATRWTIAELYDHPSQDSQDVECYRWIRVTNVSPRESPGRSRTNPRIAKKISHSLAGYDISVHVPSWKRQISHIK